MKVVDSAGLSGTERDVKCPNGGFQSLRMLLEKDGMGFGMTRTLIPKGEPQHWHYTNHLEACYCVSGEATLLNCDTGELHKIRSGVLYALDNHDDHLFHAHSDVELICVFNPPLKGGELHNADGEYE